LIEYRQVLELVRRSEKKLDELGQANERVRLIRSITGVGPRTAEPVRQRQAGGGVLRAGAQAVPVGRE
jgi:hypothetical protein